MLRKGHILVILVIGISIVITPVFAQIDTQLSKYVIDVFTDKANYEIGDTVEIGIQIDSERYKSTQSVELQIWDASHTTHQFEVNPEETFIFKYSLDKSYIGEVKVYAKVPTLGEFFKDEYFFFVGVPNPIFEDFIHQRSFGGDYYEQESNPEGYISFVEDEKKSEMSEAEKQAREEIPNPCANIREPQIDPRMQGDIGLNNPQYMEAVREAQYQYQQQIQQCFREYQIQIDEKIKQLEMESESTEIKCGEGTIRNEKGQCVPERATMTTEMQQKSSNGGGCLIATATFASELSPQVQQLRELRDNTLLQTNSGSAFMTGFNQFYYTFSPTIADWERQNPVFKEAVNLAITPLITSLSLLNYVDVDSEAEVLGYGVSLILLNIGMYFVAPVGIVFLVRRKSENSCIN